MVQSRNLTNQVLFCKIVCLHMSTISSECLHGNTQSSVSPSGFLNHYDVRGRERNSTHLLVASTKAYLACGGTGQGWEIGIQCGSLTWIAGPKYLSHPGGLPGSASLGSWSQILDPGTLRWDADVPPSVLTTRLNACPKTSRFYSLSQLIQKTNHHTYQKKEHVVNGKHSKVEK